MESMREKMKSIKSEELLNRFRSKDDLYKYITVQSNDIQWFIIVVLIHL